MRNTSFPSIAVQTKTQPIYCRPLNLVIFRTHQTVFVFGIPYCVCVIFFQRSASNLRFISRLNGTHYFVNPLLKVNAHYLFCIRPAGPLHNIPETFFSFLFLETITKNWKQLWMIVPIARTSWALLRIRKVEKQNCAVVSNMHM